MTEQLSHGLFILASYGVTAVVLGSMIAWLMIVGRQRRARIASLSAGDVSGSRDA